jgi:hypothetical protein
MYYLYLDESGDLGYQFEKAGTSRHFVVTILEVSDRIANKAMEKAVVRTLKNKLYGKRIRHRSRVTELKSSHTVSAVKQYFYRQISEIPFHLYTTILDKSLFINHLQLNKSRIYNFITHLVLKEIPLEEVETKVILTLDRSKSKPEIREFDAYLLQQLESRIPPEVPFIINHNYSHDNKLLQAVDLFAGGIYRKYESGDKQWYELFAEKIASEQVYPRQNKKESEP